MQLGVGSRPTVSSCESCYLVGRDTIGSPLKFSIIGEGVASSDEFLTNETVAAVVLILFRQQRRHKQPVEDPHQMAIGGSDLFRVIVLHGVFVPRTAAAQRGCSGCTGDASETARTHLDRAYTTLLSDRLSSAPFSNVNPSIPGATVLREFRANR